MFVSRAAVAAATTHVSQKLQFHAGSGSAAVPEPEWLFLGGAAGGLQLLSIHHCWVMLRNLLP